MLESNVIEPSSSVCDSPSFLGKVENPASVWITENPMPRLIWNDIYPIPTILGILESLAGATVDTGNWRWIWIPKLRLFSSVHTVYTSSM